MVRARGGGGGRGGAEWRRKGTIREQGSICYLATAAPGRPLH